MTTRINIYVDQGIDFSTAIDLFNSVGNEFVISANSVFYCQGRKLYATSPGASNTNIIDGVVEIDDQNTLILRFPGQNTINKKPGKYSYDIIQIDGTSRNKILEGLLTITPTMTEIQ